MGIYDRDYSQQNFQSHFRNAPQMRMTFPSLTPMVKWLLIINFVVFFAQKAGADEFLTKWFSVYPLSLSYSLQIWRLIGYQFLHGSIGHVFFNMLGLFFLGPTLEQHWGSRRFIFFYLGCGAAGGLFYIFLVTVGFLSPGFLVGASGAILGMVAACAILFPHFVVFILFFPVPIRVAAVAGTLLYILLIITKATNAGGEAAHLGEWRRGPLMFSPGLSGQN
jgi:membrane associated rhomboid family serine protease